MSYDFGTIDIGDVIGAQAFTISNSSSLARASSCSAPVLSNAIDFQLLSDNCGTNDLLVSSNCMVSVEPIPQSIGLKTTTLSRTCVYGGTVSTTANQITVTALGPVLSISPTNYNFNNIYVGNNSSSEWFYIQNDGADATGCTAPVLSNTTDFSILYDGCDLNDLENSNSCAIEIQANPTGTGLKTTTLSRSCVGASVTTNISVNGVLLADWQQEYGLTNLGVVQPNKSSIEMTLFFRNPNSQPLINCTTPTIDNSSDFTLTNYTCSAGGQASQSSCFVTVRAHPTSPGIKNTAIHRSCGEIGGDKIYNIEATGIDPNPGAFTPPQILAGLNHNCFLTQYGKVLCWGDFTHDPGGGEISTISLPENISGNSLSDVVNISMNLYSNGSDEYFCAVIGGVGVNAGKVTCRSSLAEFPINSGQTWVSNLNNVNQVAVGDSHKCALIGSGVDTGKVKCWGSNYYGGLGDGTNTSSYANPVFVSGLTDIIQVVAGAGYSCALSGGGVDAGKVKCWGSNYHGSLGNGDNSGHDTNSPNLVVNLDNVSQISAGAYHTCAVIGSGIDTGKVKCWGWNVNSQLGDGTTTSRVTPVFVNGLTNVSQVSSGAYHTCALIGSGPDLGKVKCWGNNEMGQLGDGTTTLQLNPVFVNGLTNASQVSSGAINTCAYIGSGVETGKVKCWGDDVKGKLGDGTQAFKTTFQKINSIDSASQVSTNGYSVCALISAGVDSGKVKCWGRPNATPLSTGNVVALPTAIIGIDNSTQFSMGVFHTCALIGSGIDAGKVKCWGFNGYGQLGDGTTAVRVNPVLVNNVLNSIQVSSGSTHSCALIGSGIDAGKVKCWGYNGEGQLGNGTNVSQYNAVFVSGLSEVSYIAARGQHTCAVIGSGIDAG